MRMNEFMFTGSVDIGICSPFFALHGGKKPHQSCETLSMDEHGAAALSMIKSITLGHMLNTQYSSAY